MISLVVLPDYDSNNGLQMVVNISPEILSAAHDVFIYAVDLNDQGVSNGQILPIQASGYPVATHIFLEDLAGNHFFIRVEIASIVDTYVRATFALNINGGIATLATSVTGEPTSRLTIRVQDAHKTEGTLSANVISAITDAQIIAILDAIEVASNGKICDYSLMRMYQVAGNKANAVNALFVDKYDVARLEFSRAADCTTGQSVSFPAPKEADFSGVQKRLWNPGLNTALTDALAAVLAEPMTGDNDFVFDAGYRDTRNMAKPNVG